MDSARDTYIFNDNIFVIFFVQGEINGSNFPAGKMVDDIEDIALFVGGNVVLNFLVTFTFLGELKDFPRLFNLTAEAFCLVCCITN